MERERKKEGGEVFVNLLPRTRGASGGKVTFVDQTKNLNRTLAIDSPFQTFAVGLLVEFID